MQVGLVSNGAAQQRAVPVPVTDGQLVEDSARSRRETLGYQELVLPASIHARTSSEVSLAPSSAPAITCRG